MKLSTKTVTSLLVVTAVAAAVPGIGRITTNPRRKYHSQFDRLLQRHDRKGDLRAEILGISAPEFKQMQKKMKFNEICSACGFKNTRAFRIALLGRLRNELRSRGWTTRQIDTYVLSRASRVVS